MADITKFRKGSVVMDFKDVTARALLEKTQNESETFDVVGGLRVGQKLLIPNSPDNPETAVVENAYSFRRTANADVTGLTVVDGSTTFVKEIKGNTVKSENLCPYPYNASSYNENGVKWTVKSDGTITANGTATGNSIFVIHKNAFTLPAGTYMVSGANGGSQSTYNIQVGVTPVSGGEPTYYNATKGTKVTLSEPCNVLIQAVVYNGYNASWLTFYPMINEGTAVKPYRPYFSGLKHASISSIKSVGRNLFDYKTAMTAVGGELQADGSVKVTTRQVQGGAVAWYPPKGTKQITVTATLKNDNSSGSPTTYPIIEYTDGTSTSAYGEFTNIYETYKTGSITSDINKEITSVIWGYNLDGHTWIKDVQIEFGYTATDYVPYIEDTYNLPQTIELGLGDTFNPQTGELVKGTETITLDGSKAWITNREDGTVSGWYSKPEKWAVYNTTIDVDNAFVSSKPINANTAGYNFNNLFPAGTTLEEVQAYFNGIVVAGKLKTPTTETIENAPQFYTARNGGSETVEGNANSVYGAMPTITQEYSIHEDPDEAAKKAYVLNGLAKKLDKTGGTIKGTLRVEGKTDTTLSAVVWMKGNIAYALVYDNEGETFKLGKGSVDESGNFTFDENEGLPVALRADSAIFTDGHLVKWSSAGNKFVDGGTIDKLMAAVLKSYATRDWVTSQITLNSGGNAGYKHLVRVTIDGTEYALPPIVSEEDAEYDGNALFNYFGADHPVVVASCAENAAGRTGVHILRFIGGDTVMFDGSESTLDAVFDSFSLSPTEPTSL